jgi:electron transport complex protein RnfB
LIPDPGLVDKIDACLPQTQCTLCTYPRCQEYAKAMASGEAEINQCPPGGDITIFALSRLLERPALPLNETHGVTEPKKIATIREAECIGCKLCIKACPVDCIAGASKLMHTVISDDCTGCKLCIPVCPTDCIELVAPPGPESGEASPWPDFSARQVHRARLHTERRLGRIERFEKMRAVGQNTRGKQQMQKEILAAVKRKQRRESPAS